jgi:hypothetical protein
VLIWHYDTGWEDRLVAFQGAWVWDLNRGEGRSEWIWMRAYRMISPLSIFNLSNIAMPDDFTVIRMTRISSFKTELPMARGASR